MARKNPLGKIKDVAVGSVRAPATAVGSAVGLAKGAASTGRAASGGVAKKAAGAVTSLVGRRKDDDPTPTEPDGTTAHDAEEAPAAAEESPGSQPEPVNVTEELGLDPAPVDKPKRAKKKAATKPTTAIDAAADPSTVDVTPADVAEAVGKDTPPKPAD